MPILSKVTPRVVRFGILLTAAGVAASLGALLLCIVVAALLMSGYFHWSTPALDFILLCVSRSGDVIGSREPVAIVLAWSAAIFVFAVATLLLLRPSSASTR